MGFVMRGEAGGMRRYIMIIRGPLWSAEQSGFYLEAMVNH